MKVFFIVAFCILFVATILFVWYYFLADKNDLKKAKKEFEIFGLKDGFVPQGITFLKKQKKFLLSGYVSKKNSPSRIYVVDSETYKLEKYVTLSFVGGKFYVGHAGGITNFAESVFVSSEGHVFRFLVSDLLDAKNGESVRILENFKTFNNADFCFVNDGFLWVGEFYKLGKRKTDVTHHILLETGESCHALAFAFPLSKCVTCGVEEKLPQKALALPDLAQGVAVSGDKIFVSCSHAVSKSNVFVYDNVLTKKSQKYVAINEKKIDLFEINSKNLQKTYVLPEMSEDVVFEDGRLFVVFKSAAKKYKFVARTSLGFVFSIK